MNACAFIGHRNINNEIKENLSKAIEDLIREKKVENFYFGNHGAFDFMVRDILKELRSKYPQIRYNIVLAYIPAGKYEYEDYINTIYPDGLEKVPLRFAIIERNKWMINNCDYLICYVKNTFSNASKFKEFAEKKGKIIIEL
ncbi:MAG: hypothetical protein IKT44_01045 [Clostridia bacterium]|nr:hypothetical protein [Clostridia bacterium]